MDTSPAPATPSEVSAPEDNTVAIVSYLTPIGFIVAVVMHGNKKTKIGTFHLRQALGLFVTWIAACIVLAVVPVIGWMLIPIVGLCMFVLCLIGFISAASRQMKPVPILGEHYQKWFGKTFE